jgi:hypothetical protein
LPATPRKRFVFPARFSVLTAVTLTLNSASTAALISGLVAFDATRNTILLCSDAAVDFSVITGAMIVS